MEKTCSKCQRVLNAINDFYSGKKYPDAYCKDCRKKLVSNYIKTNPEKKKQYDKKGYQNRKSKGYFNRPEVKAAKKKNKWKYYYKITPEQYQELLTKQSGECAICHTKPEKGRYLAVDHNHSTGSVRGLLCIPCNLILGNSKDRPDVLRAAALYLESCASNTIA